ncbi:MAG: methyltransferase domain-containing protein [Candidatus Micrarchaeota archaeon]|nr:methyltransferase domain-containing protein [Candidatus Micrarchaeota archaeon]
MARERILNVGCGQSRYGTDFIDFYPSRKEVIKCNIDTQKFPYKAGVFDKVVAEFVIAHLTNFSNLMKESQRVLKKGGVLDLFGSAFYGNYERVNKRQGHDADKQYALFTPISVKNLCETYGFREIKYSYLLTAQGRENQTPLAHRIFMRLLTILSRKKILSAHTSHCKKVIRARISSSCSCRRSTQVSLAQCFPP